MEPHQDSDELHLKVMQDLFHTIVAFHAQLKRFVFDMSNLIVSETNMKYIIDSLPCCEISFGSEY